MYRNLGSKRGHNILIEETLNGDIKLARLYEAGTRISGSFLNEGSDYPLELIELTDVIHVFPLQCHGSLSTGRVEIIRIFWVGRKSFEGV